MDDKYYKETTTKIMRLIRQYPYANLFVGERAALAFYELLQTLSVLKAKDPILKAALISLPHRIINESVIVNEQIIKEIIESLKNDVTSRQKEMVPTLTASKTIQILRELDNLQDMIYAMPYDIDLLDPHWFKAIQESIFRVEAPTLFSYTLNKDRKADFDTFFKILSDMQQKGIIQLNSKAIQLTPLGCLIKYKNVFNYVDRMYPDLFRSERNCFSRSGDSRRFQRGDSYKNLNIRRTLRNLVKRRKNTDQALKEDLRVNNVSLKKKCLIVLALDHSWSMARCRKLQYAKDSSAGLIFAIKKNKDQISLIAFSDDAVILSRPTRRYEQLIQQITQLRPENETNLADALLKSRIVFSNSGRNLLKHSIIITDGIPTSSNIVTTRKDLEGKIIYEVRRMRRMGITVSVICIRDDLEENDTGLARRIASMGGGSFSLVNTQNLLNQILKDYSDVKSQENKN